MKQRGPLALSELREMWAAGGVDRDTFVWCVLLCAMPPCVASNHTRVRVTDNGRVPNTWCSTDCQRSKYPYTLAASSSRSLALHRVPSSARLQVVAPLKPLARYPTIPLTTQSHTLS